MPFDPASTLPIFNSSFTSSDLLGIGATNLAMGLSDGLAAYAPTGITVNTIDAGVFGSGAGIGFCIVSPTVFISFFESSLYSEGISGVMATPLAVALGTAFSTIFSNAVVNTLHPTVGVGTGTGFLVAVPSDTYFLAALESSGIAGISSPTMASVVSSALSSSLSTVVTVVAIVGSPSIFPSSGVGVGSLI